MTDTEGGAAPGILSELRPFFYPKAVAVVGVSQDSTKFGSRLCRAIQLFGFAGPLYPVSPRGTDFFGLPMYPSIDTVPGPVDLACICVPSPQVTDVIRQCRNKGIPAVVVMTAGFSETATAEGGQLEQELASLAGDGLRIIGPNCFGIYSPGGGVTQLPGATYPQEQGGLALLSQSGGVSVEFCRPSRDFGIRLSQAVSYGNACDISEADLLRYFEADPQTRIIAAYIEGVRQGRDFFYTMRHVTPRKPVILWKGGLTPSGARAAMSHTASLSGSKRIWEALFRQTGAIQVHSLEELLDTASALYHLPPQTDPRVGVVCGGGGISVASSDACHRAGLALASLGPEAHQHLASILAPSGTSAANPVDAGGPYPPAALLRDILMTLGASGDVGSIIIDRIALSARMRQALESAEDEEMEGDHLLTQLPVELQRRWGIPVIVVLREGGDLPPALEWEAERRRLRGYYQQRGIPVYPTAERAMRALGQAIAYFRYRDRAKA
ncbi:MAG: CoA-binding protein [Dehalococcoidia bacterium]|nr:CoA-binding protein [Dehalococcoidia bacterium]MDP6782103.1 CoA-binding protein [Dehalococcoidia bacterium]